jgi:hypothetical protein
LCVIYISLLFRTLQVNLRSIECLTGNAAVVYVDHFVYFTETGCRGMLL